MGSFKDYTNQTIGNFTILEELGKGKVFARCNLCGIEREFRKSKIITGKIKSCGCLHYKSNLIKDYTNQTVGNFTILKELGYGLVYARCNLCGKEKEFKKYNITNNRAKSCGCLKYRDYTNQTIGNFTVLKELGNNKVIARCNLCGKEGEFFKSSIKKQNSCKCTRFKDYTNQTVGNFTILKELGKDRIIARCNLCGKEGNFNKYPIVNNKQKSCGCSPILNNKFTDYTNQTIGNFTILKELGKGKVFARCNLCGIEREFRKSKIITGKIKSCGCLPKRYLYKNKILKGYKFIQFQYKGRDRQEYYLFQNIKTNKQEVLSINEILRRNNEN